MANIIYGSNILSMRDLNLEQLEFILNTAEQLKKNPKKDSLKNKIIANCFFEPSTRTRLSFETAVLRLGGSIIGFSDAGTLSTQKGENFHDTIRVISDYADLLIIRHPQAGASRLATEITSKPIINAGDASNQHPTQAMIDLFAIKECQGKINGLSIALVGDLKYGRALNSFIQACSLFDVRLYLIAPEALMLPDTLCDILKKRGIRFSFHNAIEDIIQKVDILYMTRIQQERFSTSEFHLLDKQYILTLPMLAKAKANLKILHPLPRLKEIAPEVDHTSFAFYFEQAANAVVVRQALLTLMLNKGLF